jgi:hypothetical protein
MSKHDEINQQFQELENHLCWVSVF